MNDEMLAAGSARLRDRMWELIDRAWSGVREREETCDAVVREARRIGFSGVEIAEWLLAVERKATGVPPDMTHWIDDAAAMQKQLQVTVTARQAVADVVIERDAARRQLDEALAKIVRYDEMNAIVCRERDEARAEAIRLSQKGTVAFERDEARTKLAELEAAHRTYAENLDAALHTAQLRIVELEEELREAQSYGAAGHRFLMERTREADAALAKLAEWEAKWKEWDAFGPFAKRCADRLADEVQVLIDRKVLDSRSPAGDALLDYRSPPQRERADRMVALERALEEALVFNADEHRAALRKLTAIEALAEWLTNGPASERVRQGIAEQMRAILRGKEAEAQGRRCWLMVRCLPDLVGLPWDARASALVGALRPTVVRVIKAGGVETTDAVQWRATVHLDAEGNIRDIEQEVEIACAEGWSNGHDASCYILDNRDRQEREVKDLREGFRAMVGNFEKLINLSQLGLEANQALALKLAALEAVLVSIRSATPASGTPS